MAKPALKVAITIATVLEGSIGLLPPKGGRGGSSVSYRIMSVGSTGWGQRMVQTGVHISLLSSLRKCSWVSYWHHSTHPPPLRRSSRPIPQAWQMYQFFYEYIHKCFLNIFLWICSFSNILNLLIVIMNTFTEYSQDEYGFKCKHALMNPFMSPLFFWTYLNCLLCTRDFPHLHWLPLNPCHLFCQHFSIFKRIPLQIFQIAYQPKRNYPNQ